MRTSSREDTKHKKGSIRFKRTLTSYMAWLQIYLHSNNKGARFWRVAWKGAPPWWKDMGVSTLLGCPTFPPKWGRVLREVLPYHLLGNSPVSPMSPISPQTLHSITALAWGKPGMCPTTDGTKWGCSRQVPKIPLPLAKPKTTPRRPQDGPRWPQDGTRMAQDGPKRAQTGGNPNESKTKKQNSNSHI